MESKRQQQIGKLVQESLGTIFQLKGNEYYGRAFVTITVVRVTPDLHTARVYLSVYNVEDKESVISTLNENVWEIRKLLGERIRNKVRKIPQLEFYIDSTLDEVFKLENLFKKINKDDSKGKKEE